MANAVAFLETALRHGDFDALAGAKRNAQVPVDLVPGSGVGGVADTWHKAECLVQVDGRQARGERIQQGARMAEPAQALPNRRQQRLGEALPLRFGHDEDPVDLAVLPSGEILEPGRRRPDRLPYAVAQKRLPFGQQVQMGA
jgi:hypothetical protein